MTTTQRSEAFQARIRDAIQTAINVGEISGGGMVGHWVIAGSMEGQEGGGHSYFVNGEGDALEQGKIVRLLDRNNLNDIDSWLREDEGDEEE